MLEITEVVGLHGVMSYNFQEQLNDPRQKEGCNEVKRILQEDGLEVVDVSENKEYFEKGIDLIIKWPDSIETIDVKTDFQAHQTGNIPLELVEVASMEGNFKVGWAYKDIDYIYYYIYHTKQIKKLSLKKFRELAFSKFRKGYASHHQKPFPYFTLGLLIPLDEI